MTNPLLKAQLNRFIGETEFITLYDVSQGHGSSYGLGLSFSGSKGFAPRGNINGGRNHFYTETAPLFGVEGDLNITGSLRNDSVPVAGNISGNYSFSYHAPVSERGGYSVNLSGLDLSDSRAFANTFTNAVKSGLLGYAAGRVAQEAGLGDFASSMLGSIASAYAGDSNEGLTSVGHISEIRNGHELDIELVGFNSTQFKKEIDQIKQAIFDKAITEGTPQKKAEEIEKATTADQEIDQEMIKIEKTIKCVEKIHKETLEQINDEIGEENVEKVESGEALSPEVAQKVQSILNNAKKKLRNAQDDLNRSQAAPKSKAEKASRQTQNKIFDKVIEDYSALSETAKTPVSFQEEKDLLLRSAKVIADNPKEAAVAIGNLVRNGIQAVSNGVKAIVNDRDIQAFIHNLDKVPEATWQVLKEQYHEYRTAFNAILQHPEAVPDVCKETLQKYIADKFSNGPIEGSSKIGLDLFSFLSFRQSLRTTATTELETNLCREFEVSSGWRLKEPNEGVLRLGGNAEKSVAKEVATKTRAKTTFSNTPKSARINNRPQITIEVSKAELKKFGVKRKIERMKADSKIGLNVVSEPHRDPKVTSNFRHEAERYLESEGKSTDILKKVDVDHMQELQSGGSDTRENLHFLDKSFNRSIGKKINHATKGMPKGTKYEIKFKVKETGEDL